MSCLTFFLKIDNNDYDDTYQDKIRPYIKYLSIHMRLIGNR